MLWKPIPYNQNSKHFSFLGKKKCKLKFLSALQIPAIDFCSWFEPTFSLRLQVPQQEKNKWKGVGATCVKEGGWDEKALITAWVDGSIGEGLRDLKLKLVWTWKILSWNPSRGSLYSHSALCSTQPPTIKIKTVTRVRTRKQREGVWNRAHFIH